ncbi:hypothetical protein [Psychrobium sp. 1_MG-2023]|uniref:hypothetical protein n=1 Tax=Psychrobium sp. 1_MG-2023 TaxID=3062624 RepID=UPI000C338889|nr:hypothetical protein [Psychrobium sp. 1_MG-2023]MDP2560659.1 hypothetical protein [Psychrobium sp. 1_MG-2023]PKF56555.1 hypothetical protein CW748_08705 [Alteromonadales bacterium alter-6D02]
MKKLTLFITLLILIAVSPLSANAQLLSSTNIWVISQSNEKHHFTLSQIKKTYLGLKVDLDSGIAAQAVVMPNHTAIRGLFNAKVIGLTDSRIRSFWAQVNFSGRGKAPLELPKQQDIFDYILANPGTISFVVEGTPLPQGIKVIYKTN